MQSFINLKFINNLRKQWNSYYLSFILESSGVQISVSLRFFLVAHKSCKHKYGSRPYRSTPFPIYYSVLFTFFFNLTILNLPKYSTTFSNLFVIICPYSRVVVFVVTVIQLFLWFNLEGFLFLKIYSLPQSEWPLLFHNVMQTLCQLYLVTFIPTVVIDCNHLKT